MERVRQLRIEVAGGSWVSVDVYGEPDGPTLLIVPGVMSDADAWTRVAASVQGWPTVAVVNRRGRRPSGPLTADYSLQVEVDDVTAVLAQLTDVRTVFGWSYGGLIALQLANTRPVPHVIAYEPVVRPFAAHALKALRTAHDAQDRDATVEVVTGTISGAGPEQVAALRSDPMLWDQLRRLGEPVYAETAALNDPSTPAVLARRADRVDLVVGGRNRGRAPYGTTFEDVVRSTPGAVVHELAGQGHLVHLAAPTELAGLIDDLGRPTS